MHTNRNTNPGDERNVTFRVETGKLERFRVVAAADHRTVSQEFRRLMEQRIAEADATEKAA